MTGVGAEEKMVWLLKNLRHEKLGKNKPRSSYG